MVRPFKTEGKKLSYTGNKLFSPMQNILSKKEKIVEIENRVLSLKKEKYWSAISRINDRIFQSTVSYFSKRNSTFTLLPLTTRMISSPGAVYGKEAIDYTTDTCPLTLDWFNLKSNGFLSESSQIYLELSLIQKNISEVYSIYNSFRKEEADTTHLCEFHHIEFEGNIKQEENQVVAFKLIQRIIKDLVKYNLKDLQTFLYKKDIDELIRIAEIKKLKVLTFSEAMNTLYEDTRNKKYLTNSQEHFGAWEEVRLTEIFDSIIGIKEFPLLEVPFYHAKIPDSNPEVANNLDIIWPGYREILGSGQRVGDLKELENKAKIFNLPKKDYKPYLQSRQFESYEISSGFGLGWERLLQGILKMPYITSVCQFPRVDKTLMP